MSEAGFQEKTEKATPKRRADARKKGQVAQSREVPSVLILLTALGVFFFSGAWMFWSLAGIKRNFYDRCDGYFSTDAVRVCGRNWWQHCPVRFFNPW
jgi:flagellar biosynthetic protein FlhB